MIYWVLGLIHQKMNSLEIGQSKKNIKSPKIIRCQFKFLLMNTLQKALFSSISRNKNKNALWINNKYYTYKKLNDLSEKYRKVYSRSNSNLVCILLEKYIYCYACILAIVKDGRTYVPLNPKFPVEKNRKIFSTSGAQILLVESQFIDQVKHIVGSKNKKKNFNSSSR